MKCGLYLFAPIWMSGMRDDVPLAGLTMSVSHDMGANEDNATGVGWGRRKWNPTDMELVTFFA